VRSIRVRRALWAAVVLAASTAPLAGCDSGFPSFTLTPVPSESPSAAIDPGDDTLFVVTATLTEPDGSEVELQMTGHASQEWDAPGREAIKDAYIDQCNELGGGTVSDTEATLDEASLDDYGSTLMVIDVVSTPPGTTLGGPVELQLGNPFHYLVASGDGLENPHAYGCYGGYQLVSTGTVTAIVNYETGSPTADLSQWRTGRYGFIAAYGSPAVFSNCTIALTARAIEADVADVDGWDTEGGTDTECAIGYQGE
jgi:hypothetical protein